MNRKIDKLKKILKYDEIDNKIYTCLEDADSEISYMNYVIDSKENISAYDTHLYQNQIKTTFNLLDTLLKKRKEQILIILTRSGLSFILISLICWVLIFTSSTSLLSTLFCMAMLLVNCGIIRNTSSALPQKMKNEIENLSQLSSVTLDRIHDKSVIYNLEKVSKPQKVEDNLDFYLEVEASKIINIYLNGNVNFNGASIDVEKKIIDILQKDLDTTETDVNTLLEEAYYKVNEENLNKKLEKKINKLSKIKRY